MKTDTIEIEIDTPKNGDAYFVPLKKTVRGRFDAMRAASNGTLIKRWPKPIPGQRVAVNTATGDCSIIDPLYDAEHRALREQIESRGMKLPPDREVHRGGHVPTLVYWLKLLVDTGLAHLVSGELPEKIDDKPRLRFHGKDRPEKEKVLSDAIAAQTAAIERQATAFEAILKELTKKR